MGKLIDLNERRQQKKKKKIHGRSDSSKEFYGVDYKPSSICMNPDSYGYICVKCGRCGRKFNRGVLV